MKFTCTKCFFVININQIQEQKFAGIQFFPGNVPIQNIIYCFTIKCHKVALY